MNYSNSYHTKQQQAILEYMENSTDGYVTVNQIAKHLKEQGRSVGTTFRSPRTRLMSPNCPSYTSCP